MMRRFASLAPAALGTAIVMVFILAVGRPNVFTDTRDYMIAGARFYQAIRRTFLNEQPPAPRTPEEAKEAARLKLQMHFDHSNVGARSPYYGIFLYSLAHRGTLWLLTAVQTFACAWLLYLLWRSVAPASPGWTYYTLMATLSVWTSLPWTSSFAVPDIFAAVLIMAAALLFLFRDRMLRWEVYVVWLLAGVSILFHSSHILLALTLVAAGFVFSLVMKAPKGAFRTYAIMTAAAAVLAVALAGVYSEAIKLKTGDEFRRPPFLIARVLADGPGRAYLKASCAEGKAWAICRFRNLPLDDSDKILWSALPETGVFNRSNYEQRVLMEKQEFSFVLGTLLYDPLGEVGAALKNWGEQLVTFYVEDPLRRPMAFLKHEYWGKSNLVGLLRGVGECGRLGELCQPKVHIGQLEPVHVTIVIIAFMALIGELVWAFRRRRAIPAAERTPAWEDNHARIVALALFLIAAVILNAAVCGVFSGPFARYQSRVVWLVPAATLLAAIAFVPAVAWDAWRIRLPEPWRLAGETAWARAQGAFDLAWGKVDPAFLRFFVVGGGGFTIDAVILHLMVYGAGMDRISGRLVSFTVAVACTWLLNRFWTFRTSGQGGRLKEAALYFGVQCAGGAANISVYTLALMTSPGLKHLLLIPLALGSAAGLCLTYLGSKHLAFKPARGMPSSAAADTPTA